ncbi:hypothetical protein SEA_EVY_251 [Streptomyces phage Evy]|uniref:Uncharacterized protein n=1 Tax=Streptomyces phage Evy TaxID=2588514 RepID=A0A514DJX7_9CAUD|nr:hypothetical protein KNU67_gp013 [Streptomyces phage Evy]YP_010103594.1 hypothetical protein KNU67_gp047 [Streptomyces phage Evy]UEM46800.1 hypothetical protein SEA_TARGARYEN_11 [Streptomyces phage Targaryen]QDH93882.1 hypothetical protein SEA_EVY_13 [Streptomyces phage Evy]QDH94085.1 hypothetical protein SEA_EVY_251 [Streptomyces phage Evy]UEM47007.1 hypothetical protein SEA_TARGARYEN_262 [Streptomyces phage Targaryen]
MIAGIVPQRDALSLRVAMIVQGVDIEFGATSNILPYQRFDILEADETRARAILANFPRVRVGKPVKKWKAADASLLGRAKLVSAKDTSED